MAVATQLNDRFWEVQYDDGSRYQVPEDIARAEAPESFPSAEEEWMAQHGAQGLQVPPEPPPEIAGPQYPWEQPGYQEGLEAPVEGAGTYGPGHPPTIENQMAAARPAPEPEMVFGEDEVQPIDVSRSSSASYRGTGPYQEVRQQGAPARPDYAYEQGLAEEAYKQKVGSSDVAQAGMMESLGRQGALVDEAGEHTRETVAQQQEMHEVAMAEVRASEEELSASLENVSRMDMGKVWRDTSAPAKFAGLMAAGIAGWLNPTGKNSVVEQMMRIVDQSAREQAANIATEKFAIQGQERALGRLEARAEGDEKRYLDQRAMLLANVSAQITHEKSKYSSIITLANMEQLEAAALGELSQTTQARSKLVYSQAADAHKTKIQQEQFRANQARMKAQFAIGRADKLAASKAESQAPYTPAGKGLFTLESKGGRVGNTVFAKKGVDMPLKAQNELLQAVNTGRSMAHNGRRLFFLIDELGRQGLRPSVRARFQAEMDRIVEGMRPMVGANLPEEERKGVYNVWGSPQKIVSDPETSKRIVRESIQHYGSVIKRLNSMYGLQEGVPKTDEQGNQLFQRGAKGAVEPVLDYRPIRRDEDLWPDEFMDIRPESASAEGIKQYADPFEAARNKEEETGVHTDPRELDYAAEELTDYAIRSGITRETDPEGHAEVLLNLQQASPEMRMRYSLAADKADMRQKVVESINEVGAVETRAKGLAGKLEGLHVDDYLEAMETIEVGQFGAGEAK
jgi:hypothetical protein